MVYSSSYPLLCIIYIVLNRLGLGINFIQWILLRSYNDTQFVAVSLFVVSVIKTWFSETVILCLYRSIYFKKFALKENIDCLQNQCLLQYNCTYFEFLTTILTFSNILTLMTLTNRNITR